MNGDEETQRPRANWAKFSLRTLLLVMLLICVYLAGKYGGWPITTDHLVGTWKMDLPAGFRKDVTIKHLENDRFLIDSGGVLSGIYRWRKDRLVVVEPVDTRMMGLEWKWKGDHLILIDEPKGTPTGSSYLGAVLERPQPPPP